MTSVWGRAPELPWVILESVAAHARSLGRAVADDDLFLVALTCLDARQPARRVLAAEGVDSRQLLALVKARGDIPVDPAASLTFAPAYYALKGRAQGFAAALGHGRITPEHVLLALLWDPGSRSAYLLWRLGVSRERLVERLRDLGIPTPAASPPPQREVEWGERVWFERSATRRVIDQLRAQIPPGTRWGFNYDGDRAWAIAEAEVDLAGLVRAAIAA